MKRQKTKKRTIADILAQPLEPQDVETRAAEPRMAPSPAEPVSAGGGRHVARDYSYVSTEVGRIALVAGFIIVSLILTGVFLR